ncbi:MAG: glycosyltransferase family 39 protein [Terracidiphilus sp.]
MLHETGATCPSSDRIERLPARCYDGGETGTPDNNVRDASGFPAPIRLDSMTEPSTRPAPEHAAQTRLARFAAAAGSWGPWRICWLALAVRLAVIALGRYYRLNPDMDHFHFGAEMGRIARALATGRGYSDPFLGPSGPTAWVTPLFPLVLCGIFKVFGVYSTLSAWAILVFDSLLNALTIPLIWETGERCFGPRTARWSAWLWALYPAAMQYCVKWMWETTLTAFLFQLALVIALRVACVRATAGGASCPLAADGPTWTRWLGFGLVWGLIGLSNPGLLLFLPVCGVWMLARSGKAWLTHLPKAIAAGLLFVAVIAPWSWRNQQVFHQFVPFRTNFGAELYLGNGPGATGVLMLYDHPTKNPKQFELYRQMGELRYTAWRGDLAKQAIHADPPRFARLCLARIYFFWFGVPNADISPLASFGRGLNYRFTSLAGLLGLALALKRRVPGAGLFAAAFLLLPAVYYITTAHARFRHPLEPLITLLAVFLIQQAGQRWGRTLPGPRRL